MADRLRRGRRGNGEGAIDQRGDGLWRARITLEDGSRKALYGHTRAEVAELLDAARAERVRGELVTSGKYSYGRWLEQWLVDHVQPSVAITTFERYRGIVQLHIEPRLGRYPLGKLGPTHIQRCYRELSQAHLAPATLRLIASVIHRSLRDAQRMRLIGTNPAAQVERPAAQPVNDATERALSPEQLLILERAIVGHRHEWLWRVLLETGMRIGEALALEWSDVDLGPGRRLRVLKTYRATSAGLQLGPPKTKRGRRTIPLNAAAHAALGQQQNLVRSLRKDARLWSTLDLVFPNRTGGPQYATKVLYAFKAVLREAGLPPKRLHDLRHTLATRLYAEDVNPRVVQELLGHARLDMTMDLYTGSVPAMLTDALSKLDRRMPSHPIGTVIGSEGPL